MQRKCHRCDRLFTPDSHSTWCPDCREGKPVAPRKTKEQLEKEREARLEKAFKYTRYCVQCGKKFHTNEPKNFYNSFQRIFLHFLIKNIVNFLNDPY